MATPTRRHLIQLWPPARWTHQRDPVIPQTLVHPRHPTPGPRFPLAIVRFRTTAPIAHFRTLPRTHGPARIRVFPTDRVKPFRTSLPPRGRGPPLRGMARGTLAARRPPMHHSRPPRRSRRIDRSHTDRAPPDAGNARRRTPPPCPVRFSCMRLADPSSKQSTSERPPLNTLAPAHSPGAAAGPAVIDCLTGPPPAAFRSARTGQGRESAGRAPRNHG